MEEKNIRWGELIGGLLIVSCSTALVVSFWSTIAERLFLKYFVFNGVNAFMFLVGLHAARRWKLPTTSTGILLIACLLTPLNFLALSSFTQDGSAASGWVLLGELISLVVFAVLTYLAGRVVLPTIAIPFALAIMIPAGCELLVRRWIDASATLPPMYVVGGMVNLAYCLANAWTARTLLGQRRWDESHCHDVWKMLGVSSFAAVLCLGMLLWKTRRVEELSAWLAPLGIVAAAPSLFMGQLVQRRVRRNTRGTIGRRFVRRFVGRPGVVGGAGRSLADSADDRGLRRGDLADVDSDRQPDASGALSCNRAGGPDRRLSRLVSCRHRQSDMERRSVAWSRGSLLVWRSGSALIGYCAAMLGGAWLWISVRRPRDARAYLVGGGCIAAAHVLLLVLFGFARFGDPDHAVWGLGFYAILMLAFANLRPRWQALVWSASGLTLIALLQAIVFRWQPPEQWPYSCLLAAAAAFAAVFDHRSQSHDPRRRES